MINIDKELESIFEGNELEKVNDKLYLTKNQIEVLKRNDIEYSNKTIDSLMFELEEILNYEDNEELERISLEISEFNYYHNTDK